MKLLALSGLSECGKSTAGRYLESRGVTRLKIVSFLRQIHQESAPEVPFEEWNWSISGEQADFLAQAFSEKLEQYLQSNSIEIASIESLYGGPLSQRLRAHFGNDYRLVYIDMPYKIRLQRQSIRLDGATPDQAKAALDPRDEFKISRGTPELKNEADFVIDNSDSIDSFYQRLDDMLASLED